MARKFLIEFASLLRLVPHIRLRDRALQLGYFLNAEFEVKDTRAYGTLEREVPPTDPRTVLARHPSYNMETIDLT